MFSTLLAPSKNASSDSAFSRLGISRASSSSRRGFTSAPSEPTASSKVKQSNAAAELRGKPGTNLAEGLRTQEKSPLDDRRGPEHSASPGRIKPKLKTRPSSPLLGEHYRRTSRAPGNAINSRSHTTKTSGSESSSNSHYDAQKSPLSISQQTSASAVRDFNTKKGGPPIMPLPGQGHRPSNLRNAGQSDKSSFQRSASNKSGFLSRRPRNFDLSSLFPKPSATKRPLLPPHRYTHSPSPFSEPSRDLTQLHSSNTPLGGKSSKATKTNRQRFQPQERISHSGPQPIASTVNSRKPSVRIQNWFDGPEGNVSDDDEVPYEPKLDANTVTYSPRETLITGNETQGKPYSRRQLVVADPSPLPGPSSSRSPNLPLSSGVSSFSLPVAPPVLPFPNYRRKVAMSMSSKRSKTSTLEQANLMNESVLSMSSSEDESEQEFSTSPRNSIVSSYVQGLSAQAARFRLEEAGSDIGMKEAAWSSSQSKLVSEDLMSRSDPQESSLSANRTSLLRQITDAGSGNLSKQGYEKTLRDPVRHPSEGSVWRTPGTHVRGVNIQSSPDQRLISTSDHGLARRTSIRTMTVTREEEALLEAIRLKKAVMRQNAGGGKVVSNGDLPYTQDVTYSTSRRRRTKIPESPKTVVLRPSFDQPLNERINVSEDHPMKTGLYVSSSEASSPDQGLFPQSRQSSMGPSILGPSPTTDSRGSPSPVTPPQSTLHEELPPLKISTLRALDPASQSVRSSQRWPSSNGPIVFGGTDFDESAHIEDSPGWALRGVRNGRNGVAVTT